jgi:hypothetical protein
LLSPALVAGTLRHLGFTVLALHVKLSSTQRRQLLDKFKQQSVLLVTTEHLAKGLMMQHTHNSMLLFFLYVVPPVHNANACVIFIEPGTPIRAAWLPHPSPLPPAMLQKARVRAQLAKTIVILTNEEAEDPDARWQRKLALASDLELLDDDEDDNEQDDEEVHHHHHHHQQQHRVKMMKKSASSRTAASQKLAAYMENLVCMLGYPLKYTGRVDLPLMKEKMEIVGLQVHAAAPGSVIMPTLHHKLAGQTQKQRLSAQTQWLDGASGCAFGGHWDGPVRHGATKDETSLALRATIIGHTTKPNPTCMWSPNPEPSDVETWGGRYGKVCGHNEVVLHTLRPFFPQHVINSRVCSRVKPAPGNDGFDGCLEFLQWQCASHHQCMTIWDAEQWIFITTTGTVIRLDKKILLYQPIPLLKWTMTNFRQWTIRCAGRVRPSILLRTLSYLLWCTSRRSASSTTSGIVWGGLPLIVRQCIVSYMVTGSRDQLQRLSELQEQHPSWY